MQSLLDKVVARIYGKRRGWVFSPDDFSDLGRDINVRKALQHLTERKTIRRLARGLYQYPIVHPKLGMLDPNPEQIVSALAGKEAIRIQPSGAYAANRLGLTEQVPAKLIFLTDGINRRLRIGAQEIILKKTTPKNMATAGRLSGMIIQALKFLGKRNIDDPTIRKLEAAISNADRKRLLDDARYAPDWIATILRHLATSTE